jgi:molecular chaperone GrpE
MPGGVGGPGDRSAGDEGRADAGPVQTDAEPGVEEPEPVDATILPDLLAVMAERDEYLETVQRLKADFDNYRKRVARQELEQATRAAGDLVAKLLPVIDNLDLAWAHLGGGRPVTEVSEEARALAQARQQLIDVLAREGLERVDAADVAFDPTVHDAVAHVEAGDDATATAGDGGASADIEGADESVDEAQPGTGGVVVDGVLRAGYRFGGRVIRPAMVRVRG